MKISNLWQNKVSVIGKQVTTEEIGSKLLSIDAMFLLDDLVVKGCEKAKQ